MLLFGFIVAFKLSQREANMSLDYPKHGKCMEGKETESRGMQAIIDQAKGMYMTCANVVNMMVKVENNHHIKRHTT